MSLASQNPSSGNAVWARGLSTVQRSELSPIVFAPDALEQGGDSGSEATRAPGSLRPFLHPVREESSPGLTDRNWLFDAPRVIHGSPGLIPEPVLPRALGNAMNEVSPSRTDTTKPPTFRVHDRAAEVLGIDEATGQSGLCWKRRDDWTSVFSAYGRARYTSTREESGGNSKGRPAEIRVPPAISRLSLVRGSVNR